MALADASAIIGTLRFSTMLAAGRSHAEQPPVITAATWSWLRKSLTLVMF